MGRPTDLTPQLTARIVKSIRLGNYRCTAAASAGIERHTLREWERKGEQGLEPYTAFASALKAAEADAEKMLLARIRRASIESWQAAAWILERKHPARWGGKVIATVQNELSGMLAKLKAGLDAETYERVAHVATSEDVGAGAAATATPGGTH